MIKSLLLSTLYSALRAYIGSGIYDRIKTTVYVLMFDPDKTGAEKMARVLEFAQQEAFSISEYLIRAVVELVLYRAKSEE